MPSLRTVIESRVRGLVASAEPGAPMLDDPGDAGLFGPDAACWKVHGDFTSMMVGGVAALLMQMLHPRALAGVWDHSNFRDDMAGRLRRTANFIAGTTYGTTGRAEQLIARVRGIHEQVRGTAPGVGAYAADDPDLLTWVHVCEVSSFLAGYRRYRDPAFPPAEQDRYFAEVSLIAEKLGARDVPKSRAAVAAYLQAVRPQLVADGRTREVAQAILTAAPKAGGGTHLVGGSGHAGRHRPAAGLGGPDARPACFHRAPPGDQAWGRRGRRGVAMVASQQRRDQGQTAYIGSLRPWRRRALRAAKPQGSASP
jgi:uncharacterized protein (DUF2236 family)